MDRIALDCRHHRRGWLLRGWEIHDSVAPAIARCACNGRVGGTCSAFVACGPSPRVDRRDPPNWKRAPTCFRVRFGVRPILRWCIRDATGVWLKAYVFDGIQYILSFADPKKTENVVINVSYGPTTGPHDGTAELELALTAFVTEYNGTPGKPKLEIVLPAGNAYLRDGHIVYTRQTTQPDHVEWTWRLPPDNSVLCFARYG